MSMGQDLLENFILLTNHFLLEGRLRRFGSVSSYHQSIEVSTLASISSNLSRTHDDHDDMLSKDFVMG